MRDREMPIYMRVSVRGASTVIIIILCIDV